jgi:hypothetical protein
MSVWWEASGHIIFLATLWGLGVFWFLPRVLPSISIRFAPARRLSKRWYVIRSAQIISSLGFGLLVYGSDRIPVLYPISVGLLIAILLFFGFMKWRIRNSNPPPPPVS